MGQGGYHSNSFGRDDRKHSKGQARYRYIAALGCLLLIAAAAVSQIKTVSRPSAAKVVAKSSAKKALPSKTGAKKTVSSKQAQKETSPSSHFDKNLAWNHLINQMKFGPRVPNSEAHDKAQTYIIEESKKYCEDVRIEPFQHTWKKTRQALSFRNIYATQNWKNASVRVVLLTHWDSRPQADQDPNPANREKPVPSANDGASGVAVMLELMRTLKQQQPTVGILYFFTDGEDLGPGEDEMYLGSILFAQNLYKMKPQPTYGILLDMIGDKDLNIPMELRSVDYAPDLMSAFYSHASRLGLGDTFQMKDGYVMDDDHVPLNKAGLPTIDLIDFDYKPWHTTSDTEDKCSPESLGKVGKMLESWFTLKNPWRPGME